MMKTLCFVTLIEVWRTAPYLHNGSAATVMDIFKDPEGNSHASMTVGLSSTEREDLVEFVLSIGSE